MIPDFSDADDYRTILERFISAARQIMLEHRLVYEDHEWSITGLELYLWTGRKWCDPNTDRKIGQTLHGTWYVNSGKTPNYGRIDIAAGNNNGVFAGLLVRELDRQDGSAITLQKIIRGGFEKRNDHDRWTSDERDKIKTIDKSDVMTGPLRLIPAKSISSEIWVGPRISSTSNPDKKVFMKYPLRVAAWKTEKLKDSMIQWNEEGMRKILHLSQGVDEVRRAM